MRIRFKHCYDIKVKKTCCFSGQWSHETVRVGSGQDFDYDELYPAKIFVRRRDGYTIYRQNPQRSNIVLTGSLHPDVMIDVPNDIFEIIE